MSEHFVARGDVARPIVGQRGHLVVRIGESEQTGFGVVGMVVTAPLLSSH